MAKKLKNKGFREEKGRDHRWLIFYVNERETNIRTKVSRGKRTISREILKLMSLQLQMPDVYYFYDFVNCDIKLPEYIKYMQENNKI